MTISLQWTPDFLGSWVSSHGPLSFRIVQGPDTCSLQVSVHRMRGEVALVELSKMKGSREFLEGYCTSVASFWEDGGLNLGLPDM